MMAGRRLGKSNAISRYMEEYYAIYWKDASPTNSLQRLIWNIPPSTEYVVKNGELIWRVRGKGKDSEFRERKRQCAGTQKNNTEIENEYNKIKQGN